MKIVEFNEPASEPIPEPTFEETIRAEFEDFNKPKTVIKTPTPVAKVNELEEEIRAQFEASYYGNLGAMEVIQFYKEAGRPMVDLLKRLIAAGKDKEAWKLVQKVTNTKLQGQQFNEQGRIVKGVNTTQDVDVDEIKVQAKKMGFDVTIDGVPPSSKNGVLLSPAKLNESPTADLKNLARAAAKKFHAGAGSDKNPHPTDSYQGKIWQDTFNKAIAKLPKLDEIITEARTDSVILVDFQPAYSPDYQGEDATGFGYDEAMQSAIEYINKKQPSVTAFYNGADVGIEDTANEVMSHYIEQGLNEDLTHLFTFKAKSYAWLRSWMVQGVEPSTIIKVVRYMVMNDMNDSRDILELENGEEIFMKLVGEDGGEWMFDDGIYLPDISISNLKSLSGSLLGGGGRHECLQEMQLLMNAFNIKYKLVNDWIYGG